jgi:cation diffusion facilitator CzcD-associated flavoprotein CzcO
MRIAVIGSGISGIAAAAVLQREGHEVVVFERDAEPGGIWARNYPNTTLQNDRSHYHLADFPWPFEPDLHPTAEQISRYLHAAIDHFELDIRLGHAVEGLDELEGERGWQIRGQGPDGPFTHEFEFVLVAVGQYTQPKSEAWKQLPGRDRFRGRIVSERDITDPSVFTDRRVVVVGFGKSAVDMAEMAAMAGASSVSHVFRTARWLIPLYLFGVHMSYALFARHGSVMIPSWVHPSGPARFLHARLGPVVDGFWSMLAKVIWTQHRRDAKPRDDEARARVAKLRPKHGVVPDLRSAAAVAPRNYFRLVAEGKIEPIPAELVGFDETGVRLGSVEGQPPPSELPAELVVLALGSGSPVFPFLPQRYRDLLESEPDGAQLYRHLLDPRIPRMAFAGLNHGFMHVASVEVATLWLSAMLRGELELPERDVMLDAIEHIRTWKRAHVGFEPSRGCATNTRYQQYLDVMLGDLGFSPYRKSNPLSELFARYGAADYAGLVEAFQRRRSEGPLHLRPLPLDT